MSSKVRILLAKPGLDGHDQGAKVVVRGLLEAGFEVIYTGLRQSPEMVAEAALEEGVDVIALSSMAGVHIPFCKKLKTLIDEKGLGDKLWIIGGSIPKQDHDELADIGLDAVFQSGSRIDDIVDFVKGRVA